MGRGRGGGSRAGEGVCIYTPPCTYKELQMGGLGYIPMQVEDVINYVRMTIDTL